MPGINPIEVQIITLLCDGVYIKDIATRVCRSKTTVKNVVRKYTTIVRGIMARGEDVE